MCLDFARTLRGTLHELVACAEREPVSGMCTGEHADNTGIDQTMRDRVVADCLSTFVTNQRSIL